MQYDEIPKLTKHNIAQHGVIMESDDRILSYSQTSEFPLHSTLIRLFTSLEYLIGYGTSDLEDLWVLLSLQYITHNLCNN